MSMSKKDYVAIAAVIKRAVDRIGVMPTPATLANGHADKATEMATIRRIAYAMADGFAEDNPRFDSVRFIEACGFEVPLVEPEDEEPTPEHLDRYIEHVYGSR